LSSAPWLEYVGCEHQFWCSLFDVIVKELGVGGFGKVMLGRHKEEKKEVAIKFMDVSESCKTNLYKDIF
jgi:hypothetical protein